MKGFTTLVCAQWFGETASVPTNVKTKGENKQYPNYPTKNQFWENRTLEI